MAEKLTQEQELRMAHCMEMAKLIRAFRERFGDAACQVVERLNGDAARAQWREIAERSEDHSIEALIALLWEPLKAQGFAYDVERTDAGYQMRCTRCAFYDMARYCGITEEAFYMFCAGDPYIAEGFNPNIGLKRTKTLMQGQDCCDHLYYYKEK